MYDNESPAAIHLTMRTPSRTCLTAIVVLLRRAVAELEQRVRSNVRSVENPLFAPGVPLAAEFTSMLAQAKETAFDGVRPYLPKGVEPETALFMLVTLPVLTVALRAADENSRRPMPPPKLSLIHI